jgi:hypothetical protein
MYRQSLIHVGAFFAACRKKPGFAGLRYHSGPAASHRGCQATFSCRTPPIPCAVNAGHYLLLIPSQFVNSCRIRKKKGFSLENFFGLALRTSSILLVSQD